MQQVAQPAALLQQPATALPQPADAHTAAPVAAPVAQAVTGLSMQPAAQPAVQPAAAPAVQIAAAPPAQPAAQVKSGKPGQHLLKHEVTQEAKVAAIAILGADPIQAGHAIWELRQPELREMFGRVFGVPTASGNNGWMRGKLMQALGLPARWHPDDEVPKKEEAQVPPSPAVSHGSQPGGDQPEGRKRGRLRQVPARLQQQADDEDSSPPPRARPAKKRAAAAAAAAPAVPAESYGGGGGASAGSGPGVNMGTHGSGSATSAAAPPPTIVLMMGPGAQLPYWAGGPPDGQAGQQQLAWAGRPGGPAPGQQVVVLQQQQNGALMQQNGCGSPQSVEQAALAALQALGMLPAGGALPQGLMPAVLNPPDAGQQQHFMPPPDNAALILQPGQVGLPWPIVLPPGGPAGSGAPGSTLWSSFLQQQQEQQRQQQEQQQQQQQQQQQLLHLQLQMELQRQMQQQMPPPAPRPPQGNQAVQAMQAVDVSNGGAARTPAWSPFDEAAAVPLPAASSAKQEPDQQAPAGNAQPAQHAEGGESQFLHQQLLLSGLQPDSSLFAGVEALGWSASFATLSADLHTLFNAWQDGRVSLSLPLPSGLPLSLPSLPSMPPPQT